MMAAFVRVLLVLLVCWIGLSSSQTPSRLDISKEKISLTPNTTSTGTLITVICQPPAGVGSLSVLNINKKALGDSTTNSGSPLVKAIFDKDNGDAKLGSNAQLYNATASGSISTQKITLTMNQARCSDEGRYVCVANYATPAGSPVLARNEKDLKAEVSAGQAKMTPFPDGKSIWAVNETLTLSCKATVGTVNITNKNNPDPQITWFWEFRNAASSSSFNNGWNRVSDSVVDPPGAFTPADSTSGSCKTKEQISSVQLHLTLQDTGRTYRCYVRRAGSGFTAAEQLADSYTVGTVTADGKTTPPQDEETSSASVGGIVGGVIGALILIAVIIIIIYFLVIRPRRQKKEKEEYHDGIPELGDKEGEPPLATSADPNVVYSQPSKRGKDKKGGMTNKGMDESDEKKHGPDDHTTKLPPDDNDDRRHGRRGHKDKKQPPAPQDDHHNTGVGDHKGGDRRHRDDDRYDDYDRRGCSNEDNNRRGPSGGGGGDRDRRRHRDGDDYDDRRQRPAHNDNYGQQGRRNRGYENDRRPRGHHSSSEDGGTDHSFVNTSQYSMGDGDPTIGTAI